jgi:hypothetical protein
MADDQKLDERTPTLENFLAGVPLNAEMEQLARDARAEDEGTELPPLEQLPSDPFDPLRPLDDADRKSLLKLTQDPGYEVLSRIRRRTCAEAEKVATLVSQKDPLGNAAQIAQGWAYLAVMRQVIQAESATIEAELAKLKSKVKQ